MCIYYKYENLVKDAYYSITTARFHSQAKVWRHSEWLQQVQSRDQDVLYIVIRTSGFDLTRRIRTRHGRERYGHLLYE